MYEIYQYDETGQIVLRSTTHCEDEAIATCGELEDQWPHDTNGAAFIMQGGNVVGDRDGLTEKDQWSLISLHERMGSVLTGREH